MDYNNCTILSTILWYTIFAITTSHMNYKIITLYKREIYLFERYLAILEATRIHNNFGPTIILSNSESTVILTPG